MLSLSSFSLLSTLVVSTANALSCTGEKRVFDPFIHKPVYNVGVHAIRGLEEAIKEANVTFSDYLTATAGQRFDPPIRFTATPLFFDGIFKLIDSDDLDFLYANPGVYSCVGTELGATSLATTIRRVAVRDKVFELDVYGGAIATRADNKDINNVADLKDKVIGAGAIIDLMGGQMQIYEMFKAGMSYVNDPKQMIFTKDQDLIIKGILSGRFDAGFIRTNQIELSTDADGNLLDPSLFKILEPKIYVMDDGDLFPFLHSTDIYPEWPVAALTSVPEDVALEVQEALMKIGEYAKVGRAVQDCRVVAYNGTDGTAAEVINDVNPGTTDAVFEITGAVNETSQPVLVTSSTTGADVDLSFCVAGDPADYNANAPCDTTWELAELARVATNAMHTAGFRPSRSYFELREMQEQGGFMEQDEEDNHWFCTRPSNLYEGIVCPEGFFRRSEDEFNNGCAQIGLKCDENPDYSCFCKPCVKAYDVDVYEYKEGDEDLHLVEYYGDALPGCEKMSICGEIQQNEKITIRIYDNELRDGANVEVTAHAGPHSTKLDVKNVEGTHAYEVVITDDKVQVQVVEILVNGKPISQSPIRVMVLPFDCDSVYGEGSKRTPNEVGECVCQNNTYQMGQACIESAYFFLIIFAAVFVAAAIFVFIFLGYKKQQNDSMWHINVEELSLNEPPEIVGQGAFGVVVLGQYRGTKVAVKRVLPPQAKGKHGHHHVSGSQDISLDMAASTASADVDKKKSVDDKGVKFNEADIEAQTGTRSSMHMSQSNSAWEKLLMDDRKYSSALRILESATLSNHGSTDIIKRSFQSSQSRSYILEMVPMCFRWDDHARLKREFVNEMRLLSRLRHPCITTVMGAVVAPRVDPMLVMEYMEYGSLYDLMRNETMSAGGDIILQIIRDVVQGIQFLHASKPPILHGDLKSKNILVDSRFRAKVADFGFSHIKSKKRVNVLKGTPYFMAPEYLKRKSEFTTECDMYAFGMILYEIYARADPFEGEDPRTILPKVCHPRVNKRPPVPEACPSKIADIMKKCWSANPVIRPTAKDVDYVLVEMSAKDAEPLEMGSQEVFKQKRNKETSLYDVFPKHIADALTAGKKVEPESHEIVTVVFSDIVGFTKISQTFDPAKVCDMLDRLYLVFDDIARKHKVFKVETIGDAYMGVTNLDGSQFETHVKNIAGYAIDAIYAASKILIDKDAPERGTVQVRMGFHSGPVVSNVIGSLNPRFGLFGDTVNTASRMESNSINGRIQCSHASAQLLMQQAPELPLTLRGKIKVKGKGTMMTYWVGDNKGPMNPVADYSESEMNAEHSEKVDHNKDDSSFHTKETDWSSLSGPHPDDIDDDSQVKINAVADILTAGISKLVASRPKNSERTTMDDQIIKALEGYLGTGKTLLEEAIEPIKLEGAARKGDAAKVVLSQKVQHQIFSLAETIFIQHKPNQFHGFDHAMHAATVLQRLLSRAEVVDDKKSFGIGSDKLCQFAITFAALIHDLDHRGVPNFCLAKSDPDLDEKYEGKSPQEQNSFHKGWDILMSHEFDDLRACIYHTQEELIRFRQIVVKAIVATDIFNPDLQKIRMDQWEAVFKNKPTKGTPEEEISNLKAAAVIELLIQTADVAHTMQSWTKYNKWNKNLFIEMNKAYVAGHLTKDPAASWYEGEMKFFDTYVLSLAERLHECGVFDKVGENFVRRAKGIRAKWEEDGKMIVRNMKARAQSKKHEQAPDTDGEESEDIL